MPFIHIRVSGVDLPDILIDIPDGELEILPPVTEPGKIHPVGDGAYVTDPDTVKEIPIRITARSTGEYCLRQYVDDDAGREAAGLQQPDWDHP